MNENSAEQLERLDHLLNVLGEYPNTTYINSTDVHPTYIKEERREYLVRFMPILDRCPHALAPSADGKGFVKQLEDGARTLQELFPDYIPFELVPMPESTQKAYEIKERTCFELALLFIEKYPNAIETGIGGEGLVRAIKGIADSVGNHILALQQLGIDRH